MGYFSNLEIYDTLCDRDHSYTLPEMQLLWRLEDLEDRLAELVLKRKIKEDRVSFSQENLRYVLPEHFMTVSDVKAAIELAVSDLKDRYGIHVREEFPEEEPAMDEITGMQISFLDILSMQSQPLAVNAA